MSLHGSEADLTRSYVGDGAPSVTNKLTGTHPLVLHFNGGGKPLFHRYAGAHSALMARRSRRSRRSRFSAWRALFA